MSEINSRPNVRTVSATSTPTGAIAAALLFASAWRALSGAARSALRSLSTALVNRPVSKLTTAPALAAPVSLPPALTPAEQVQVSTLAAIAGSDCVVQDSAGLRERLEALQKAATGPAAAIAQSELFDALRRSHREVFNNALAEACVKASAVAGFPRVVVTRDAVGDLRVIAESVKGHSLVSEICTASSGEVRLATEVVGVADGSCHGILDRFNAELDRLGVHSGPPSRKSTGGVCELAASRFAARIKSLASTSRARKLNQKAAAITKS